MPGQQQHVELHRKIALRRSLLAHALPGAAYLPYCGDGDLAAELYIGRALTGCGTDPERIATIRGRLFGEWRQEDADTFAHFGLYEYAVADFDAYAYPYDAFRRFWAHATKARRLVLFFTDGALQSLRRGSAAGWRHPDGTMQPQAVGLPARGAYNFYWASVVEPWLRAAVAPWTVTKTEFYRRGGNVLYFGAVVDAPATSEVSGPRKDEGEKRNVDEITDEELGYDPMRRDKFDAKAKRRFLAQIAKGATNTAAGRSVGVTLRTVDNHLNKYPRFREALEWCQEEAIAEIESSLFLAAKSGNVTAIQVFLYNRAPERWADRRRHDVQLKADTESLKLIADVLSRAGLTAEQHAIIREELAKIAQGLA